MGFLDRYFRGEAVPEESYGEREAEEEEALPMVPAKPRKPARQAPSAARPDNVVDFRARTAKPADSKPAVTPYMREAAPFATREPAAFTTREREPAGTTREFDAQSATSFSNSSKPRASAPAAETAEAYVVFKRLKDFTMASQVADKMVERKIVILNLESCDDEIARRVLDFIGGVAYACGSMVKRIAGRVFMITPKGVSADGEFFDELRGAEAAGIRYDD